MAYNPYPMNYNPYNPYASYSAPMQQPQQAVNNQAQQQVQNGGFVVVQNKKEAEDYLVANGTSVTFLDMNAKKLYVKTRGFSTLDTPTFESYKITKDDEETTEPIPDTIEYAKKEDIEDIKAEMKKLKTKITKLAGKDDKNE